MGKSYLKICTAIVIGAGVVGVLLAAKKGAGNFPTAAEVPNDTETLSRKNLVEAIAGEILFDSNRSGTFGIFAMEPDGSDVRTIVDTSRHEMFPEASPDGKWIVFGVADSTDREAPTELWIVDRNGENKRLLTKSGNFPSFSSENEWVYFEKDRQRAMKIRLDGTGEEQVFPRPGERNRYYVIKPKVSADGRYVAFSSDRGGRWNAWYGDVSTGEWHHIHKGCEPTWFPNPNRVAWIKKAGSKERSGIYGFERSSKQIAALSDEDAPWGHEYFPGITRDGRYLLHSATGPDGHDHNNSHYQIFAKDLQTGERIRVTFDTYNNRWPTVLTDSQ